MRTDTDFEPIQTERLLLRRSRLGDAEAIAAYRSDPDVSRYQGWDRTDPDGVRGSIHEMVDRSPGELGGWVQFSVEERESGKLVGDVGLNPPEEGVIEIGYTVAPAFQGKGYATEAVRALVDYAFDTLGAEVIRAYAAAVNTPSIKLAERVGLTFVERFEHSENGVVVGYGVRYELRREDRPD